jgi:XRE family transcriptional regulator, aerobic/anaerobic benzoate catabolism transcriptional regulator
MHLMAIDIQNKDLVRQLGIHAVSDENLLLSLGKRVREVRARRGMTRKLVAKESDVSERHLAQVEAGAGNISILLLQRIAVALNVTLVDLFASENEPSAEQRLIQHFLERVPKHDLEAVVSRLEREFGHEETLRRNRIAFIGLRGAGKSTLGSKLAEEWKIPFIELDREIEKDAGMPLGEIFSLYGQAGYRRIERRTLERVIQEYDRAVISVAGGMVSEKETYEHLLSNCYAVWLKAHPEEHMSRVMAQGDFRPVVDHDEDMEDMRRILEARDPFYRRADLHFDTSGDSVEESFDKLQQVLQASLR